MKHEFHNPDNLTPEQVGEGYRLLLKSEFGRQEEQHQEIETWLEHRKDWHKSKIGYLGTSKFCTYRVPLSTWPLPEEDPHRELKEAHAAGKTLQWKFKGAETWMTKTANFDDYPDNCDYRIKQEVHKLQECFAEPQLTYHQWRGEPRDQESPPTDNDPWECLLRTNADLGREVSELKKQRDALSSQLQGVIVACHLRGYNVGDSLGEWIEKQFADAQTNLMELLHAKATRRTK